MEPEDVLDLLVGSPDGVYAVDMGQRVFFWNVSAERLLGWKAQEVLGRLCYEVLGGPHQGSFDPAVCARNCSAIQQARQRQIPATQKLLAFTRRGEPRWFSVTHVLVPSAVEDAGALVHIFHDPAEVLPDRHEPEALTSALAAEAETKPRSRPAGAVVRAEELTPREQEVLRLMSLGLNTQAIAKHLVIAVPTVRNHVQRVLAKLGVHSRLEAVALASRQGLLRTKGS